MLKLLVSLVSCIESEESIRVSCGWKLRVNFTVRFLLSVLTEREAFLTQWSWCSIVEHGKGRKCVILVGRSQKVYNVSWDDLESVGGLGSNGYWAKYSLDGMHLYSTPSVAEVTGYNATELGSSLLSFLRSFMITNS